MKGSEMHSAIRTKLSIMMFLQYAIWGSWGVSMGSYMAVTLKFTGVNIGNIYSTTAIAAMISPLFIGILADRLFATEKLIAVLHLIGAALLVWAANTPDFSDLFKMMIAYSICYMPTLALTNSISFANMEDPEKDFPLIRIFGTFGWIAAGLAVSFVLTQFNKDAEVSNLPIYMAAFFSVLLGLFSFTLPHTPPKGKTDSTDKPKGKSVLQLLADPSFLVFVVCSFLICIPLSFYYGYANIFLGQIDAPAPTGLQTIGQISEIFFMAAMPFFILRLGVKKMLAIGMLAWVIRYVCFSTLSLPFIIFGLVLHGICYDFFFVASQIYVDKRADDSQRASAQSFIAFITLGVGMYVGALLGGMTMDHYKPKIQVASLIDITKETEEGAEEIVTDKKDISFPNWNKDPDEAKEGEEQIPVTGIAKTLGLNEKSSIKIEQIKEDVVIEEDKIKTTLKKDSFITALGNADSDENGEVNRAEWRVGQRSQWTWIWLLPGIGAGVTLLVFLVGFKDIASTKEEELIAEGSSTQPSTGDQETSSDSADS
jgi:nucleoside transporter